MVLPRPEELSLIWAKVKLDLKDSKPSPGHVSILCRRASQHPTSTVRKLHGLLQKSPL